MDLMPFGPVAGPDLAITPDIVLRAAQRTDDLSSKSETLAANTDLFTADQVGNADLAAALQGFVGEWNQQLRSSSQVFASLASQLAGTTWSYQDTDKRASDELASSSPAGEVS